MKVCERWRHSFENFLADMGERRSPEYSLDRWPDKNGDYAPGNCRWATDFEQNQNKRDNVLLTFGGQSLVADEWGRRMGIAGATIQARIKRGWTEERALTAPIQVQVR